MHELDALGAPARGEIAVVPLSDPGRVRTENQDALAVLENTSRERLILVADGMGGHRGGETASRICLKIVERVFREPHGTPEQRLRRGLELANEEIYSHALANPELKGMGTTAVVALLAPDRSVWVAWVGDSRCYRLRNGALESLTRDHSLMAEWIAMGVISPDAAQTHPRRHELTRAIGQSPDVTVDVLQTELRPGDRLLLCSDGLHGCVADRAVKHALAQGGPEGAARALIDAANAAGGSDNVTVVVVALPIEAVNMPPGAAGPEPAATVAPEAAHAREVMLDLESTADLTAPLDPESTADLTAPLDLGSTADVTAPLDLVPDAEVAAELDVFARVEDLRADPPAEIPATASPVPEPAPARELVAQPEPALDPDISFADLGDEIAAVVAESDLATESRTGAEPPLALEVAESATEAAPPPPLEPAAPPPVEASADFLLPSAQRIEIPLMTPVRVSRRRRGLDVTSVVTGIGGTLVIAGLGFGIWLYTGSSRVQAPEAAVGPSPAIARSAPIAPRPAPARPRAPAVAPAPAPAVEPAPAAAPVEVPAPAPVVEPPVVANSELPARLPAREPAKLAAPLPPPAPPRPAATESVPAAADPSAAITLPTARGFELPAPMARFVDDWLRALSTHDHALLASLGFPDEPAAFAGTARSRDGYRLVAAELDEERSHGGRYYLRIVVSYAFRDASGRFRTEDEQRFILRDVQGRLRFEGRWQQ